MSTFFAYALAAVLLLLLIVWLGPYLANRLLIWYIDRTNNRIRELQERRAESHEQIRTALEPLRQRVQQSDDGST